MSGSRILSGRRRTVAGALVVVVAAATIIFSLVAADGAGDEPLPDSQCTTVHIFTGQFGAPYSNFGYELKARLEASEARWEVEVRDTDGSAANIYELDEPGQHRCSLALSQLNTAVDALAEVNQFDPDRGGRRVDGLRTIGPVHNDIIHMVVRDAASKSDDFDVFNIEDLCDRPIAPGPPTSGTRQISDVLLRVAFERLDRECEPKKSDSGTDNALRELAAGIVDAVFWSGGAGSRPIANALDGEVKLRIVDLEPYRQEVIEDWNMLYDDHEHVPFFPGAVFRAAMISPEDYPAMKAPVHTIGVPNGLVAHRDADAALVRQAAIELFRDRAGYERALWGDNPGKRTIPDALSVYESPMFCYVPLHPEAEKYYVDKFGRPPSCEGT